MPDLLAALAFQLSRQCEGYGRLAFERLIVGQVIRAEKKMAEVDAAGADRAKARAEVARVLEAYHERDQLRAFLQRLATAVLPAISGPVPGIDVVGGHLAGLIMDGLMAGRLGRRISLGKGQDWYGFRGADPLDELVELNARFHERGTEGNREWVDQLLLAAFLADLQDDFKHGRAARSEFNCVVLVDNADTPDGRHFLLEFVRACQTQTAKAAPVTVIATSRGALVAEVVPDVRSYPALPEADAEDAFRDPATRWYPVSLPALTKPDVEAMATDKQILAGHAPDMVYQFTSGHPRSTARLIEAIAQRRRDPVDIGRLLDSPDGHGDQSPTIGDRLLDSLLAGLSSRQRDEFVTIAAARNREEAEGLSAPHGLLARHDASVLLTSDLWQADGAEQPAVLPPVLRRLLSRRLARRTGNQTVDWDIVHRRLRPIAPWDRLSEQDKIRELYHALALDDLRLVTRRLAAWLTEMHAQTWLTAVRAIVAAPRRSPASPEPAKDVEDLANDVRPADPVDAVSPETPPIQEVAALIAGLWIAADPLTCERRRDLHHGIAAGYDMAAGFSLAGKALLHTEAARHHAEALRWP